MKTDAITNVIAMIAPLISCIASSVAFTGDRFFSSILACTASITTIASSTTTPIAITNAKREMRFKVIPKADITAKAPIKETGTAMVGIMVERTSPKKINTTMDTKIKASNKV